MNELILRASPLVAVDDAAATGAMASAADGTGCIPPLAPTARALSATVSAVVRARPVDIAVRRLSPSVVFATPTPHSRPPRRSWAAEWPTDSSM